ncbi:unnamed protein product [Heterotrigona itama]|uniref:Uncharacterized protein n=1 Tax=Heterotrigona itama TaxID=395501 RepID=A0A6V7GYV3_9HYME|nr:unnamed protein product [Heterotrigona itama]
MADEYLDNCLPIEVNDDNAFKEKTRIAEVAATTLCRLNSIMKQMQDWRDDRMKLRSNIWRLKLALRVAARETDDTVHAVPLIEHQRAEIKRLETSNKELRKEIDDIKSALVNSDYVTQGTGWKSDDKLVEVKQKYLVERERLNNEIQYLKSRLNEVEEGHEHSSEVEHLKCKLKHFMMVDYTMEIIFTDIVNKVAETIANLSEELVNINDRLHRSRVINNNLYVEIDKLKAVIRHNSGNLMDYQKRIVELDNLTKRLKMELNRLKVNFDGNSWNVSQNCQYNLDNVERLAKGLKNKLRNDHEALLAGGDPDCLKYVQKIIELSVNLKQLHVELARFTGELCPSTRVEITMSNNKHFEQLSTLESTLKEINVEIDKLKNNHVKKHYKIDGGDGLEYLNKIEELEAIIEEARSTMNGLNRRAEGNSNESKDIEKLEDFVGRMCHEIKQLEMIVVSNDRPSTFKKIEQLEGLIVRLRSELAERDDHVNVLERELLDTGNLLEQRIKELEDTQREIVILGEENKVLKEKTRMIEERALEMQRDQEDSRKKLEQLQQVKREASLTRKKLQNLQGDKEGLLKEMGKIRDTLQKKNDEAANALIERNTTERALNAKIADLARNLQITSKENEKLQNKVNELERAKCKRETTIAEKENENAKRSRNEAPEKMKVELQQLKVNLTTSRNSLESANREIADLKMKLKHLVDDKTRLEENVFHLESKKETLVYQLGVERTTAEERLKEISKLKSDYNELDLERANLKKEKEQLNTNLTNVRIEKELLEESVRHVRAKCSVLEDEIDKYACERDNLLEEIRNFRMSNEHLSNKLEDTQTGLNGAGDKIKRLKFENSKLQDDVSGLTLKNVSFEDRVQTLLSEKSRLVMCVNELENKNTKLNGELNEVKTANEYSNVELNKLKTDYSKIRSENTALQVTLDETTQSNETLKKASEELNLKLNAIHSECRILDNQLKILETMNATLKKEKELLEQEYVSSLRSKICKIERDETVTNSKSTFTEQNEQVIERVTEKRETVNGKSGKYPNNKTKLMKAKKELKRMIVENESLRFEMLNLRSQNFEIKMQLARMKDDLLQKQKVVLIEDKTNELAIKPISNKLEIVNLYYKEVDSYSSHGVNNVGALAHINQSNLYPYDRSVTEEEIEIEKLIEIMNKLKVENIALKMEVNSLKYSFVANFTKDEKRKDKLRVANEEIHALKAELTKLRDEKESLRVRLDTAGSKLDRLESEKVALKDELYTLRKINSDLKHKASELQCVYQKLKEKSLGFERCIMRTIKKVKKYTITTDNLDNPDDELKILLKKYISNEEILHSIEQKINIEDI